MIGIEVQQNLPPDRKRIAKVLELVDDGLYAELRVLAKHLEIPVASWPRKFHTRGLSRLKRIKYLSGVLQLWSDADPAIAQIVAALESFVAEWEKNPSKAGRQVFEDLSRVNADEGIKSRYGIWLVGARPMEMHHFSLEVMIVGVPLYLRRRCEELARADAATPEIIFAEVRAEVVPAAKRLIGTGEECLREFGAACLSFLVTASVDPVAAYRAFSEGLLQLQARAAAELKIKLTGPHSAHNGGPVFVGRGELTAAG